MRSLATSIIYTLIHKIDSYIIISTISECLFYVSELFTQERKDTNQRT